MVAGCIRKERRVQAVAVDHDHVSQVVEGLTPVDFATSLIGNRGGQTNSDGKLGEGGAILAGDRVEAPPFVQYDRRSNREHGDEQRREEDLGLARSNPPVACGDQEQCDGYNHPRICAPA